MGKLIGIGKLLGILCNGNLCVGRRMYWRACIGHNVLEKLAKNMFFPAAQCLFSMLQCFSSL
jgi:hypothetical protein